jgi:hypothetical protein
VKDDGFGSPEEAALAEWGQYPNAMASVVSVDYIDEWTAVVVVDTEPSHPMTATVLRNSSGRWEFGSES